LVDFLLQYIIHILSNQSINAKFVGKCISTQIFASVYTGTFSCHSAKAAL